MGGGDDDDVVESVVVLRLTTAAAASLHQFQRSLWCDTMIPPRHNINGRVRGAWAEELLW